MHLHSEVLVCTSDNFRLHIQGLFSPTGQRFCFQFGGMKSHPLLLTATAFLSLELASLHPPTSLRTGYCPSSLSISALGGYLVAADESRGCLGLSGRRETEKLLPPSPSTFFLPCLCLLEQNWQQPGMFSFCNPSGQSSWWRVEGLSSGLGELP